MLERGHDAVGRGRVRDLVLAEGLVREHRRDGVPLAGDLLLVVLVDTVVHREVVLKVHVVRAMIADVKGKPEPAK